MQHDLTPPGYKQFWNGYGGTQEGGLGLEGKENSWSGSEQCYFSAYWPEDGQRDQGYRHGSGMGGGIETYPWGPHG